MGWHSCFIEKYFSLDFLVLSSILGWFMHYEHSEFYILYTLSMMHMSMKSWPAEKRIWRILQELPDLHLQHSPTPSIWVPSPWQSTGGSVRVGLILEFISRFSIYFH
jgi:hypothetical protein